MDGEEVGAREVGKKDEREANDKVDKGGLDVEEEIVRADGKSAPFGNKDEDKPDKWTAGDDGGEDGADAEKNVHKHVKNARESVAGFSDENVI